MSGVDILVASSKIPLSPAPIPQSWILEGNPTARSRVLATSDDNSTMTMVWDCTAGRFNWFYNLDETVSVVAGGMTLTDHSGVRRVTAGDVIYFPAGSQAMWTVEDYIRKVAVVRQPIPTSVSLGLRAMRKFARTVTPASRRQQGGFVIVRPDPGPIPAPVAGDMAEADA